MFFFGCSFITAEKNPLAGFGKGAAVLADFAFDKFTNTTTSPFNKCELVG